LSTYSDLFVCLMGMGTVFVGLIVLVYLTNLLSSLCREKKSDVPAQAPVQTVQAPQTAADRQALIAALSAAIAEDMGTDVSAIRILSVKKLS